MNLNSNAKIFPYELLIPSFIQKGFTFLGEVAAESKQCASKLFQTLCGLLHSYAQCFNSAHYTTASAWAFPAAMYTIAATTQATPFSAIIIAATMHSVAAIMSDIAESMWAYAFTTCAIADALWDLAATIRTILASTWDFIAIIWAIIAIVQRLFRIQR